MLFRSGQDRGNVQEDVTFTANGQLTMTDVDHGAIDTWSVANGGAGTYGNLSVDQTGHWTYTLNNAAANVQALAADETDVVIGTRARYVDEADKAGLKGISIKPNGEVVPGDVIVAINGNRMTTPDRLLSYLDEQRVGDQVTLTVRRESNTKEVKLRLQAEQ